MNLTNQALAVFGREWEVPTLRREIERLKALIRDCIDHELIVVCELCGKLRKPVSTLTENICYMCFVRRGLANPQRQYLTGDTVVGTFSTALGTYSIAIGNQ